MSFEERALRQSGIRVGRLGGIEVFLHPLLLLFLAIQLLSALLQRPAVPYPWQTWIVSAITFLIAILCHELGHCAAAVRLGGSADRILLWPLGGLAVCDVPADPRSRFLLAAAGPAVNAALAVLCAAFCLGAGWSLLPTFVSTEAFPTFELSVQYFLLWNLFPMVLNLLPCLPLDGGHMLQASLWARLESQGHATLITLRVGQVAAALSLVTGLLIMALGWLKPDVKLSHPLLWELSSGFLLLALVHFFESKNIQHRLLAGEEEEGGIFGYDFSSGYTSLERTATRRGRTSLAGSLRERFRERGRRQRSQQEAEVKEQLDEILAKIHEQGMGSLTRAEQRILRRASKLLRR